MSRTTPSFGAPGRLPGAAPDATIDPAWQPWVRLVELTLAEAEDAAWAAMVPVPVDRPAGAPLLHGSTLRLDGRRARAHLQRLADAVGLGSADDVDAGELIRAAIARDEGAMMRAAIQMGVSSETIAVLGQLAAMPLLHACARSLAGGVPPTWQRGWCPVCGAWPLLAEMRGIERDRRLRCGCCTADWSLPVLHCVFCDEIDHHRLGFLVVEGEGEVNEQHARVEICQSCHGYLKTVTTLGMLSPPVLVRYDLATVPIDLAAQERGYARPARPAWAPDVHLIA